MSPARRRRRRPVRAFGTLSPTMLWQLAERLTRRDRWLLAMLAEHQVFTSPQITRLCYDGDRTTRQRLALLHSLGALDRSRPYDGAGGPPPFHYTLGPGGAASLASERGVTVGELGYRRDLLLALASSRRIGHQVGVNGLFVAWIHASRPLPAGQGLTVWWSERRATAVWGRYVRPDGYGTWCTADGHRLDLHVEYDTGTEPLTRVVAKLPGYRALAAATGITTPLLIWLPTAARETHLRHRLTDRGAAHGLVPIVTASPDPRYTAAAAAADSHPADLRPAAASWLPLDGDRRLTLDGLARRYGTPSPPASVTDDLDGRGLDGQDTAGWGGDAVDTRAWGGDSGGGARSAGAPNPRPPAG